MKGRILLAVTLFYVLTSRAYAIGPAPWASFPGERFLMGRTVADIDNDGRTEIVISSGDPNTVIVGGDNSFKLFVINNDGTVRTGWPVDITIPGIDLVLVGANPVVKDLDGDGVSEIIVALRQASVLQDFYADTELRVYRADGSLYPGWPQLITPSPTYDEAYIEMDPVVGDIDRDGSPEIIVNVFEIGSSVRSAAKVYAFRRDGTLVPGWPYDLGGTLEEDRQNWTYPVIGNVDNTPENEVLTATTSGKIHIIDAHGNQKRVIQSVGGQGTYYRFPFIVLTNLNTDARMEILFSNATPYIAAYDGDGNTLSGWPVTSDHGQVFRNVIIGDLDNDCAPEIIAATYEAGSFSKIFAFKSDGNRFSEAFPFTIPINRYALISPVLADITGDGVADLLYMTPDLTSPDTLTALYGFDARGSALPGSPLRFADPYIYSFGTTPTIGDFNRNGRVDLVLNLTSAEDPEHGYIKTAHIYLYELRTRFAQSAMQWPRYLLNNQNNQVRACRIR